MVPFLIGVAVKVKRSFPNIMSKDIEKTCEFFRALLDFKTTYTSDWFIHMEQKDSNVQIGILKSDSSIVPNSRHGTCEGVMLTFVVESADKALESATKMGLKVLEKPRDLFYGQRRLLIEEPESAVLIDISSECEPSKEFLASL